MSYNLPYSGDVIKAAIRRVINDLSDESIENLILNLSKTSLSKKADLENGKVPASQLPSYVDDVIEGKLVSDTSFTVNSVAVTPESGKIYLDIDTNQQYRWSGTKYVEISSSLALGETESTAYSGAKGKQNAEDIKDLRNDLTAIAFDKADKHEVGVRIATVEDNLANKADKDELNLKIYGTTDVYTLTDEDVWIEGNRLTGQKINGTISHDIIIIPEGITEIVNEPQIGDDGSFTSFALNLKADKIILPSTLTRIIMGGYFPEVRYSLNGELILNDNITYIDTTDNDAFDHYIKKFVINSSLQELLCYAGDDMEIIIPKDINSKLKITFGSTFVANMYVYNAFFDFSNVIFYNPSESRGTIYGYAGSTAEKYAKENNITFVNIGSDYSIPVNKSTSVEATIFANEYYTFTGISSLTVTLDTASTTKLDEFMFSFETPSDISAFSFGVLTDEAVEIKWVKEPNLKPDYIYEVSVVNGVGVIAGTAKEVA